MAGNSNVGFGIKSQGRRRDNHCVREHGDTYVSIRVFPIELGICRVLEYAHTDYSIYADPLAVGVIPTNQVTMRFGCPKPRFVAVSSLRDFCAGPENASAAFA
jgi:hypothetical protein